MAKSSKTSKTKPAKAAKPAAAKTSKKPAKPALKPAAPKPTAKPAKPAKPAPKAPDKAPAKSAKAALKPVAKSEPKQVAKVDPKAAAAAAADKKNAKGITVVATPKPSKKPKVKRLEMPASTPLLKPGMKWKPLIASGPKAPPSTGIPGVTAPVEYKIDPKARLPKKELDRYRDILLHKRAELVGDISNMEDGALRQSAGSLSSLPQHMADQGSDAFEQSLSLDLAQVDRVLLKEIDAALSRIEQGTYGVCERTGKRISPERLAELPWARYSIEAAREMERRTVVEQDAPVEDDSL